MTKPTVASFVVRGATAADVEKMLALWQDANQLLASVDSRYRLVPDAEARWRLSLQEWLCRDDVAIFVAESTVREGQLIGYIIGSIADNLPWLAPERFGYISDLAVDSHGKASGIGRNLFEALKGWFKERGISTVEARVPHRHPIAQAFWRALGASELYEHMWLKLE
jgi:ribosomal protein S18 acetylase RimI-like enzyme